jgi:hypothetical protein
MVEKPVALPPGRGRLATKPLPTGSLTFVKMMGMVCVWCSSDAVEGVLVETTSSGCSATVDEEVVGMDQECVGPLLHEGDKGRVDVVVRGSGEDFNLPIHGRSPLLARLFSMSQ